MNYENHFRGAALKTFKEMKETFPFDSEKDYLIVLEYDGCEYTDLIGVAKSMSEAKKVLKIAYRRIKGRKKTEPALLQNGRHISFCV